jgi:hypothetical protein
MANVSFIRNEISDFGKRWDLIRACLNGSEAVKLAGDQYLPRPNAADTSVMNQLRFDGYVERAVFYQVASNTLDGLIGQVFAAEPVIEIPDNMDLLKDNADGGGVGLTQMSKKTLGETLAYGRSALLVDYPDLAGAPATKQQVDDGVARPTILSYSPWSVINWRTKMLGAKKLLSLVVIQETCPIVDDGFEIKEDDQWRVLFLDDTTGNYSVDVYRKATKPAAKGTTIPNQTAANALATEGEYYKEDTFVPTDGKGQPLREIPFTFVGSLNNDENCDKPMLYGLCVLNMAHYRNSADYEDSCYMVGQPTFWASGLTKNWVKEVLNGVVEVGSRGIMALPVNGQAGILQVAPNAMPMEAMLHKEKQMVAIGAKLVENRDVQRTLGEAQMDNAASTSALATVAKNTGAAYTQALKWCSLFMTGDADPAVSSAENQTDKTITFKLSTDFAISRMSFQERAQLMAEWQGGGITWGEYRGALRQSGIAIEDDDAAKEQIDNDHADAVKLDQILEPTPPPVLDANGNPVQADPNAPAVDA